MHVYGHTEAQIDLTLIARLIGDVQVSGDLFAKQLLQKARNRPLLQGSGRRGVLFVRRGHHHFPKARDFGTGMPAVSTAYSKTWNSESGDRGGHTRPWGDRMLPLPRT